MPYSPLRSQIAMAGKPRSFASLAMALGSIAPSSIEKDDSTRSGTKGVCGMQVKVLSAARQSRNLRAESLGKSSRACKLLRKASNHACAKRGEWPCLKVTSANVLRRWRAKAIILRPNSEWPNIAAEAKGQTRNFVEVCHSVIEIGPVSP